MTSAELKRHAKQQEWAAQIQNCRSSGLPVRAWCRQEGINASTYYRWERELLTAANQAPCSGVPAVTFAKLPEPKKMSRNIAECCATLHIGSASLDICPGCDAEHQKSRKADESAALTAMVDRSAIESALLLADRGYESYNNLAHIQEKGWNFLIRIKDGTAGIASGLALPATDEFDVPFHLKLTNKQSNEVKELLKDKNHYAAFLLGYFSSTVCIRIVLVEKSV